MGNGIRHYWSAWCMLLCTRLCRSGTDPCCDKTWKKSCIYERMHSTKMGITGDALQDLAACSLLHDNALTQYIYEEFHNDLTKIIRKYNVKAAWHPLHLRGGKLKNVPVSDGCEKCDFISP